MMGKKLLAGVTAFATGALAVPAMADQDVVKTATTTLSIEVAPTASIRADDDAILLKLNGIEAENYAMVSSSLTHLNNTAADISVAIENGVGATDLPIDLAYWLFHGMTEAAAYAELQSNVDTTPGVFRFSGADVNNGLATALFATVAVSVNNTTGDDLPVIYAADARQSLPPPNDHVTVVTWTIAPAL